MSGKNKAMIAAAIAAVLLLVGSGVARCSMERADDRAIQQESVSQEASLQEGEGSASTIVIEEGSGLKSLIGTSWVGVDDHTATLTIVDGAFVEGKDGQNAVTYFTIDTEEEKDGVLTATVMASSSMTEAATPALVTVYEEGGRICIKCDALSAIYTSVQTEPRTLSFSGVTSKLEESLGVDAAKIEAAVSARAAAVSPNAQQAVWDAEVWVDFANNTATTSFTLDDGASTIISVTRASDGTVEAL